MAKNKSKPQLNNYQKVAIILFIDGTILTFFQLYIGQFTWIPTILYLISFTISMISIAKSSRIISKNSERFKELKEKIKEENKNL